MSQNTAITVTGLKKSYKNLKVLEGISFSVQQGSILLCWDLTEQARPQQSKS
jgi:ABC-type sugar transport system ATPase subunit